MLLSLKPVREANRFVASLVESGLRRIDPETHRTVCEKEPEFWYNDDAEIEGEEEFCAKYPRVGIAVKCAAKDIKEPVPFIVGIKKGASFYNNVIELHGDVASRLSRKQIKILAAHELGHKDTLLIADKLKYYSIRVGLSSMIFNIYYMAAKSMQLPCGEAAQKIGNTFVAFSVLSFVILGAYGREEEFRCDKKALELKDVAPNEVPENFEIMLKKIEPDNWLMNFLCNLFELINSHPGPYSRKRALETGAQEMRAGKS